MYIMPLDYDIWWLIKINFERSIMRSWKPTRGIILMSWGSEAFGEEVVIYEIEFVWCTRDVNGRGSWIRNFRVGIIVRREKSLWGSWEIFLLVRKYFQSLD